MTAPAIRLGTAGWALPRAHAHAFPGTEAHLGRYSGVFSAAEINSTFHRPHRESTYIRWAESVPEHFRFCVKLRKTITHGAKLVEPETMLKAFFEEIAPLASKVACILVQLPPSLAFDASTARRFFGALRRHHSRGIACEPRHPSWLTPAADALLVRHKVGRVAADPEQPPGSGSPGGWTGLRYFRWHGSPRRYYSSYADDALAELARVLHAERTKSREVWCIFDNTVTGAAIDNALTVRRHLEA